MNPNYLDFEQPIADLKARIDDLKHLADADNNMNIAAEISGLEEELNFVTQRVFSRIDPWQNAQLARHPLRPHSADYIPLIFDDFEELHGDRLFADDAAIMCGPAKLDGQAVMVIAQEKGRDLKEKMRRNFAMPRPEGYRKAARMMQMAERFNLPIITFIDTPGAYPGIDAEERGQSNAIAENLALMSRLRTPIISTVIGEGGSGGALAIGVCDQLMMLQYSTYAVISPEGCASILWKSASHAQEAAAAMGITASRLLELGLIDQMIAEPAGGAHRNLEEAAAILKQALKHQLSTLVPMDIDELLEKRFEKFRDIGRP
ncbi:acetyl-CoA carboxylase carboxyltransferase subunit alpha [Bermanella sp. WJH001]|uniref:acetyl-CoA carboxylase carboxyltransferase subunit alpha n=1 Tax=Bermanella sp. WJH001 TaxID=3048005 RepID=UPI0024BEA701|nr:acetyl-CoA carboxylase carboxyltransferase subunit alpha [Bermanella sp. WJH001]MDJ1539695.1 acetyl-CoA carboxylase carboxyltransferase subunit alpha [Bermanella sp. WJH001]